MINKAIRLTPLERSMCFHLHTVLGHARMERYTMYRRLGRRSLTYCPDGIQHPLKELKLTPEQYAGRQLGYIPEAYLRDAYGVRIDMSEKKRTELEARYAQIKEASREKQRAHMKEQYLKSLGAVR